MKGTWHILSYVLSCMQVLRYDKSVFPKRESCILCEMNFILIDFFTLSVSNIFCKIERQAAVKNILCDQKSTRISFTGLRLVILWGDGARFSSKLSPINLKFEQAVKIFSIGISLEELYHILFNKQKKKKFLQAKYICDYKTPQKLHISVLSHHKAGNDFIARYNIRQIS